MAPAIRLKRDEAWLDIASYGRGGVGRRLSRTQIEQIRRTVRRTPEVMVKVSSGSGASTCRGVSAHFNYISRQGDLEIETDDGERLIGDGSGTWISTRIDGGPICSRSIGDSRPSSSTGSSSPCRPARRQKGARGCPGFRQAKGAAA